jgi:hypothetical protein
MNATAKATLLLLATLAMPSATVAADRGGFQLDVLVGGAVRPELFRSGTVYIEALQGREYTLRLHNPLPCRVAVALSVDGLNTIDAKHTTARGASKWVLGPYETVEIVGWQVSGEQARRFYFTGERDSYGAALGHTADLGVIEAVFYREKVRPIPVSSPVGTLQRDSAGAAAPRAEAESSKAGALADDYAATGIGRRTDFAVEQVQLELEARPAATARLRYEFRPQLERLGLLPRSVDPLQRRERSRGFDRPFCPEP